ncbi:tetratricopeptide repeat protein [Aquisalimonas sp.]|uniref:tetratricopeptide repeat protein n=1 Tax=Aquisalimonas sp. TaxID=1872621 RepID=UPI0025C3621C|nr:tetratricopeptide repeat protein [Aquisalimonas sp.]
MMLPRPTASALRDAALSVLASDLEQVTDIRHHDALQDALAHARVLAEQPGTAAEYALIGWLGRYEWERGSYRDAERFYRQQSEGYTRLLGEEHPDTLISMGNLAGTLRDQGDLAGARALQEQVLDAYRRVLGEEHPDTLSLMGNLAQTLQDLGDLADARALHEQVLAARRRVLGEEHPDTSISAWNLFMTLCEIQDDPAARATLEANLVWLLQRDPATLAADQRKIREMLQEILNG